MGRALLRLFASRRRDYWFEMEYGLCLLLKPDRLRLPEVDLTELFDESDQTQIRLERMPRGSWSSPVVDVVALCKLVMLAKPTQVLELGSFRGFTAYNIASHLSEGARLVTVDSHPDHGEAYRGTPQARRIERRVGRIGPDVFDADDVGRYDLIILDADHRYEATKRDTNAALPLLAKDGWLVWHDYANWGFFSGACRVPELLLDLAFDRPIAQLSGTNMAVHRPVWSGPEEREAWLQSIRATADKSGHDPWKDDRHRS